MKRIYAIIPALSIFFFISSCILVDRFGGNFLSDPEKMYSRLSPGAVKLINTALKDLDKNSIYDYHVHIMGSQTGITGCYMNPEQDSWLNPMSRMRYFVYLSSSGINDQEQMDREYVRRLLRLIKSSGLNARYLIFALDKFYDKQGKAHPDKTHFYVPNAYIFKLAEENKGIFIPVISVNPHRKDALPALENWASRGVKYVKWIPNSMGIDPSDKDLAPFYRQLKKHRIVLISHTGEEAAIDARGGQELGNPLRLRLPLDLGVKVIAAHCASLGQSEDIDNPGAGMADNFRLFIRLMDEKKYEGLLFGDISALTHFNRKPEHLKELLGRRDLHHRLVHGSDYPLPSVNFVVHTGSLLDNGFISKEEREWLNEIYKYNPLVFDLVLKRILKISGNEREGGFRNSVFKKNPGL